MENKTITLPLTDAEYSWATIVNAVDTGAYRKRRETGAPAVKGRGIICSKFNELSRVFRWQPQTSEFGVIAVFPRLYTLGCMR
jgi:hypothetical protein